MLAPPAVPVGPVDDDEYESGRTEKDVLNDIYKSLVRNLTKFPDARHLARWCGRNLR